MNWDKAGRAVVAVVLAGAWVGLIYDGYLGLSALTAHQGVITVTRCDKGSSGDRGGFIFTCTGVWTGHPRDPGLPGVRFSYHGWNPPAPGSTMTAYATGLPAGVTVQRDAVRNLVYGALGLLGAVAAAWYWVLVRRRRRRRRAGGSGPASA